MQDLRYNKFVAGNPLTNTEQQMSAIKNRYTRYLICGLGQEFADFGVVTEQTINPFAENLFRYRALETRMRLEKKRRALQQRREQDPDCPDLGEDERVGLVIDEHIYTYFGGQMSQGRWSQSAWQMVSGELDRIVGDPDSLGIRTEDVKHYVLGAIDYLKVHFKFSHLHNQSLL